MPEKNGVLEEIDGRPALRFERALAHPPERVWEALTDPDRQLAWHPTPARFEPRDGGRAEFVGDGHAAEMADGVVTDWEPPRLLGYTWGAPQAGASEPDHLRWEIRPHDGGCVLVLVHSFDDRLKAARDGSGWHLCLDALEADLGDAPRKPHEGVTPQWRELNAEYERRFGIAPEEATPPPSGK